MTSYLRQVGRQAEAASLLEADENVGLRIYEEVNAGQQRIGLGGHSDAQIKSCWEAVRHAKEVSLVKNVRKGALQGGSDDRGRRDFTD